MCIVRRARFHAGGWAVPVVTGHLAFIGQADEGGGLPDPLPRLRFKDWLYIPIQGRGAFAILPVPVKAKGSHANG